MKLASSAAAVVVWVVIDLCHPQQGVVLCAVRVHPPKLVRRQHRRGGGRLAATSVPPARRRPVTQLQCQRCRSAAYQRGERRRRPQHCTNGGGWARAETVSAPPVKCAGVVVRSYTVTPAAAAAATLAVSASQPTAAQVMTSQREAPFREACARDGAVLSACS